MSVLQIMATPAQSHMEVALVGGSGDAPQIEKTGLGVTEAALDVFHNFVEVCAANVVNERPGRGRGSAPRRSARFTSCPSLPSPTPTSLPTPLAQQVRAAVSLAGLPEFRVCEVSHGHRRQPIPRPWALLRGHGHPQPL